MQKKLCGYGDIALGSLMIRDKEKGYPFTIPADGSIVKRDEYSDLFEKVEADGLIVSENKWQAAKETKKNVDLYSYTNDTSMMRVPLIIHFKEDKLKYEACIKTCFSVNEPRFLESAPTDSVLKKNADGSCSWRSGNGIPVGQLCWSTTDAPLYGTIAVNVKQKFKRGVYPELEKWVLESHNYYTSELQWDNDANAQEGVCGKFCITNTHIIFPCIKHYVASTNNHTQIGTWVGDAIRDIYGYTDMVRVEGSNNVNVASGGAFNSQKTSTQDRNALKVDTMIRKSQRLDFMASRVVPTASENRPKTVYLLPCIKVYDEVSYRSTLDADELMKDVQSVLSHPERKDNPHEITPELIHTNHLIYSPEFYTVGAGGDFANLTAALEYCGDRYPSSQFISRYKQDNSVKPITITIKPGTVLSEQILIRSNLKHIKIVGETDTPIEIDNRYNEPVLTNSATFVIDDRAVSPWFAFNMRFLHNVRNKETKAFSVHTMGTLGISNCTIDNCASDALYFTGGRGFLNEVTINGSQYNAIDLNDTSDVELFNCHFTHTTDVAIGAFSGSRVSVWDTEIADSRCAIDARSSLVSASVMAINNCRYIGVLSASAATVHLKSSDVRDCTEYLFKACDCGDIYLENVVGGGNCKYHIDVFRNGRVSAPGTPFTKTTQAFNTVTQNGCIVK